MKTENFITAIRILTKSHSTVITINHVETGGSIGDIYESPTIHITECTGKVVNDLKDAGFALSMGKNGMLVEDYSVKE